jgi:prephenate dehydrogenase
MDSVAILGTGLIGTSIGAAAVRVGCGVSGWDGDAATTAAAATIANFRPAATLEEAVEGADLVVVCVPIGAIAGVAARALEAAPDAIVTDAGSVKVSVVQGVAALVPASSRSRFVGGHPMGGSERSGPAHAAAALVDGIVWVLTPSEESDAGAVDGLASWVSRLGAQPVRMDPARHDRLVAFVSHLPQVASTALMGLAATEESDEPEILLLAAGGFRDLTRLAASNPALWSDILVANRTAIARALDLYVARLTAMRDLIDAADATAVERTFSQAKAARLTLATKPQVRAGVAVIQVPIPDRPGALAELTLALGDGDVNIEDLQIVHSAEGGRGMVHLTVSADAAGQTASVLAARDFDPTRLA